MSIAMIICYVVGMMGVGLYIAIAEKLLKDTRDVLTRVEKLLEENRDNNKEVLLMCDDVLNSSEETRAIMMAETPKWSSVINLVAEQNKNLRDNTEKLSDCEVFVEGLKQLQTSTEIIARTFRETKFTPVEGVLEQKKV